MLKKHEVCVIDLSHTTVQGWLYSHRVADALSQGWRVIGVSVDRGVMHVLMTKHSWFWQR